MHYIILALLVSIGVSVRSDQILAYREHEALIKAYPCKDPQPRVFELKEVIGEDVLKEKINDVDVKIKPATTVLHRCYFSGCCQSPHQKCTALETDDVTLTFQISGSKLTYLEVAAVNHTSCGCV